MILLALSLTETRAQSLVPSRADSLLDRLQNEPISDYESTLPLTRRLRRYYLDRGDTCRFLAVNNAMATCYDALGMLDSALHVLLPSLDPVLDCSPDLYDRVVVNLASVYLSMGEPAKADSVCGAALDRGATPAFLGDLLYNQAVALGTLGDLDGADRRFARLQELAVQADEAEDEIDVLINRGTIRGLQRDMAGASLLLEQALARCEEVDCPMRAMILLNLGAAYGELGRLEEAIATWDGAMELARAQGDLQTQVEVLKNQAEAAHALGDHDGAWELHRTHMAVRDSLLDVEKVRAITDMQEKYESEVKARQIKELEVQNLDGLLRQAELRRTRNIYLFTGVGVLAMATALWSRLRFVHRSRAAIRREKEVSEGLLHNILPEEVADELRLKGYADAREFEQATILFTDFKGFTAIAERLTPAELVAEIDTCFKAFDAIMERAGIEKIKTIGDAYMAAGGLPDPSKGSPADVVLAALELQAFMARYKVERQASGLPAFEMRVGIHTGPVVAGIVGVKKFAYDIWGDTVNTAARMESSGAVGEVNISGDTYRSVKDRPELQFEARGRVEAKGKGELEMFFVRRRNGAVRSEA